MSKRHDRLRIGIFLYPTGHHRAAWRLPDAPLLGFYDMEHVRSVAQAAERAKLDFVFFGDNLFTAPESHPSMAAALEPFTALAFLAAATTQIGLVATASATYSEPYHIARLAASLDHLSGGRAAINIVTSRDDRTARNFGGDILMDNETRYERAGEFIGTVRDLWDSVEDGAAVRDKNSGQYYDFAKFHRLDRTGKHFKVDGPLNILRPRRAIPSSFRPEPPIALSIWRPNRRTCSFRGRKLSSMAHARSIATSRDGWNGSAGNLVHCSSCQRWRPTWRERPMRRSRNIRSSVR